MSKIVVGRIARTLPVLLASVNVMVPLLLALFITIHGVEHAHAAQPEVAVEMGVRGGARPEAAHRRDSAAAMEEYSRRLADYRKDMAAYEADPGEWTADIPQMPARPEGTGMVDGRGAAASAGK